jgi:plastocyanin
VSWLAILLSLAALGGNPAPGARPTLKQCNQLTNQSAKKQCKKAAKAKPKKQSKAKPKAPGKPAPGKQETKKDSPTSTSPTQRSEPRRDADPDATPTPTPSPGASPTPTATPTATPTPGPVYPSRTGVDLVDGEEWAVRPSYRILAAGRIDFVATNVGEDDHDLSVRQGARLFGRLPLAPGESDTLTLDLAAGSYTLYCSLDGHEDAGMRANISVR